MFLDRPNRFLVHVRLEGSPHPVEAHLPDPGRLRELLVTGRRVFAAPVVNPPGRAPRRTRWTLVLVETPDGKGWVSLDTTLPNRLLKQVLEAEGLHELPEWTLERAEATVGTSRFDFLLRPKDPGVGPKQMILEAKSVTLVENGVARFPDAVTERGARHVREMTALVRGGTPATVIFLIQRDDAEAVEAAWEIDPDFADALAEAHAAGVRVLARSCAVDPSGVTLLPDAIPVPFEPPAPSR